ncbi:uncharacterized protein LOC129587836 [Paramacrobiotus metropolitanus]|uniref:uncharacterized protein LOC129587836 n=1 Tax=Paramacrobiotus metropolitanus TaxID=2943436 RepID=UPI00244619DB|nr:uncharacterized protein LOC129587836 [Paramacrobiotus metropolitanus]XP_055337746.1 uncharacterized protein LOC129587836 [Paramacrobiotus metropolitanus]XP_055337747.1 uncharacterized protein LOC129587836 [Paramacrobiotus metropolitanus]XP_055337748.1 uncharacterized protein LOC129587836 [Paramacrobiotus metropolitanus]XP_055337749.1 uncharacterized protein LOC129587836 [Paramacrobiotus metropolitanus]
MNPCQNWDRMEQHWKTAKSSQSKDQAENAFTSLLKTEGAERSGPASDSRDGSFPAFYQPPKDFFTQDANPFGPWANPYRGCADGMGQYHPPTGTSSMRPLQPETAYQGSSSGRGGSYNPFSSGSIWSTGSTSTVIQGPPRYVYDPEYEGPRPAPLRRHGGFDSRADDKELTAIYEALSKQQLRPGINPYAAYATVVQSEHQANHGYANAGKNRSPYANPYADYALHNQRQGNTSITENVAAVIEWNH